MNSEAVRVVTEIRMPQLICPRTRKRWSISVNASHDVITHYDGRKWRKRYGSVHEAVVNCKSKWTQKRKQHYALPVFPVADEALQPKAAQLIGRSLEIDALRDEDYPVSLHPIVRGEVNGFFDLTKCNALWYDEQPQCVTPQREPLLTQCTPDELDIQLYDSLLSISTAYKKWIWFFVLVSPHEAIIVNAVERNNLDAPWNFRRHMIEVACTAAPQFVRAPVNVFSTAEDFKDHLFFYRSTPDVLGVDVLGSHRNFNGEYLGRISFQKLIHGGA